MGWTEYTYDVVASGGSSVLQFAFRQDPFEWHLDDISVKLVSAAAGPTAPAIASFSTDSGPPGDGITTDNTLTLTGTAAANQAGPGIVLSYVMAGLACGFAALCYAEFAAMIPIALGQGPGAGARASMAKVIIGGQLLSLLLALLVTPVTYSLFDSLGQFLRRVGTWFGRTETVQDKDQTEPMLTAVAE